MSTRRRVVEISIFVMGFFALVFFLPTGHRPSAGAFGPRPTEAASASDRADLAARDVSANADAGTGDAPSDRTAEFSAGQSSSHLFSAPFGDLQPGNDATMIPLDSAEPFSSTASSGGSPSQPASQPAASPSQPGTHPTPNPAPSPSPSPAPAPSPSPTPAPANGGGPGSSGSTGSGGTSASSGSSGSGSTPGGPGPTTTSTSTTTTTKPPNSSGSGR